MRVLVFGTSCCASAERLHLLERWAESLQRIAPDMDQLIVDSQSPVFATAAHPFLSRFGPRVPCPSEPTPVPVGRRSVIGFPDDVGQLQNGGRDGWGRAFSQGLLCAMSGGYDYVIHIEGDLLTRLDLSTICRFMHDRRIDALGTVTPLQGWLETGLLFLRVDFVSRSRLVERYDWRHRTAPPHSQMVLSELLGGDLYLQLWRGAMGDAVLLKYRTIDLHWLTHAKDPKIYDEFMAGGAWPAREFGAPTGLVNHAEAATWYREVAGGIAAACSKRAMMYASGQGVAQDYAEAAKWYRKAADQGDAAARNNLGNLYYTGQGVAQDYVEAAKWYRKAAEQGDVAAQSNLGVLYHNGQGVPQNYREAAKWYRKAAEQGDVAAQYHLGVICFTGQGVAQDAAAAATWFRKAADQGDADAQYNLGIAYSNGQGVPLDHAQAYLWLSLAAGQGVAGASTSRAEVAARMTPAQIEQAETSAAAWKPQPTAGR